MNIKPFILGALIASAPLSSVDAREAVIGLSPNQSPEALKSQIERVIQHLVQTVQPGEQAHLFDGYNAKIIGTFSVPNKKAYANPRAKLQVNRGLLRQLKRFMGRAKAVPGGEGQINMPALLQTVRQNYPAKNADLIVLGSPITNARKAPSLNMVGGRVPNDAHVAANAGASIYGTSGLSGTLEGYAVYFGMIGPDWSVSTAHAYRTERFWALSTEGHGGFLQYIGDDLETLFRLAGKDVKKRVHAEPLIVTDKLEMLQFAPDRAKVADIYTQPLEVAPAPKPIWRNASGVRVGITWQCTKCDLDLHVRPSPSSKVIFFNQAATPEGKLYKDFTNSPASGFETVELIVPVDLSQMKIAINFYGGKASHAPVKGEIRIAIGNKVWAAPFAIEQTRGNKGQGAKTALTKNKAPNKGWLIIDPMKIVTLN